MIRLGRVYGGYMVDVQASNRKLVMRSERMLGKLTGCTEEEAPRALEAAGGRVKTAVLVLRGLSPKEADEALEAGGGNLGTAPGRVRLPTSDLRQRRSRETIGRNTGRARGVPCV